MVVQDATEFLLVCAVVMYHEESVFIHLLNDLTIEGLLPFYKVLGA